METYSSSCQYTCVQVWSLVCAYIVILLIFWSPERKRVLKLVSVPVWMALLLHVGMIFGPFRVPVIFASLVLLTVSVITGFSETRAASTDGKNCCLYMYVFIRIDFFKL